MGTWMSWLFLFAEHRNLYERLLRSESRTAEHERVIQDLTFQLERQAASPPSVDPVTLLQDFQDRVLQELPYPEGKVPESAWLTPPYPGEARA